MKTLLILLALCLLLGCGKDNPAGPAPTTEPTGKTTTLTFSLVTTQAFPADTLQIGCVLFTCDGGGPWLEAVAGAKLFSDTTVVGKVPCMLKSSWTARDSAGTTMAFEIQALSRYEDTTGSKVFVTADFVFEK